MGRLIRPIGRFSSVVLRPCVKGPDHSQHQDRPLSADTNVMESFLVSYEYGSGTIWGYVAADGAHEVAAFLPEVDVWEEPPPGLSTSDLADIALQPSIPVDAMDAIDVLLGNFQGMNAALVS